MFVTNNFCWAIHFVKCQFCGNAKVLQKEQQLNKIIEVVENS
jgi:hypothetical protein